jgi:peptide/nickel transport system permease protein
MAAYVIRRILWMFVLLLSISFITFIIFYLLPSTDPALLRAGRGASSELIASIREQLGLNEPWYVQYWVYLKDVVLHFDFGYSYFNQVSVKDQIVDRLPASITLGLGAMVLWLLVGIPIGIIAAVRRGTWADKTAMGIALVAISAPVYWLGLVSLYLFSKDIGIWPIFDGAGTYPLDCDILQCPGQVLPSLILPWIVLAASFAAIYARFLRGNLTEVLGEDYIRTARAKGLGERRVILRHGVRSAGTPLITILGLDLGILLGGAILTETVFNIPGVGRLTYDAIQKSDLPTVQGTVLISAFFIIFLNLIVDIVYAFLDPRVRYD